MRLIFSFFLSLFLYSAILFFFGYFIFHKNKNLKPKEVYIHQAVVVSKKIKLAKTPKQSKPLNTPKTPPVAIEKNSNSDLSKGGKDISFDELFQGVDDNIDTTKITPKKQNDMTKIKSVKSDIQSSLQNIKKIQKKLKNLQPVFKLKSFSGSKKESVYISNEFGKVWAKIETKPNDFISLKVNIENNQINIVVISSNLDTILLNQFLTELKNIDISKISNFSGIINFKVKLKE